MKNNRTYATATMIEDNQMGIPSYDLQLNFRVDELLLDFQLVPYREKKKLNNIEEYVAQVVNERIEQWGIRIMWYDEKWSSIEYDYMSAMSLIIDIVYNALHRCSVDWRKPFHVHISDPKEKIKEYGEEWKTMIEQLNAVEDISIPQDKIDLVLEKLQQIQNSMNSQRQTLISKKTPSPVEEDTWVYEDDYVDDIPDVPAVVNQTYTDPKIKRDWQFIKVF